MANWKTRFSRHQASGKTGWVSSTQRNFYVADDRPLLKVHVTDEASPMLRELASQAEQIGRINSKTEAELIRVELLDYMHKDVRAQRVRDDANFKWRDTVLVGRQGKDLIEVTSVDRGYAVDLRTRYSTLFGGNLNRPDLNQFYNFQDRGADRKGFNTYDIDYKLWNKPKNKGEFQSAYDPIALPNRLLVTRAGYTQIQRQRNFMKGVQRNLERFEARKDWFEEMAQRHGKDPESARWLAAWRQSIFKSTDAVKRRLDPEHRLPLEVRREEIALHRKLTYPEYMNMVQQVDAAIDYERMARQQIAVLNDQLQNENFLIVDDDDPMYDEAMDDLDVAMYFGLDYLEAPEYLEEKKNPWERLGFGEGIDPAVQTAMDAWSKRYYGKDGTGAGRKMYQVYWNELERHGHLMDPVQKREFWNMYGKDSTRYRIERAAQRKVERQMKGAYVDFATRERDMLKAEFEKSFFEDINKLRVRGEGEFTDQAVRNILAQAHWRSEKRVSAHIRRFNGWPSAIPHIGLFRNWGLTMADLVWSFAPPLEFYKYIGKYDALREDIALLLSLGDLEAYMTAWVRGSMGLTKKVQRRKLRRRIWDR